MYISVSGVRDLFKSTYELRQVTEYGLNNGRLETSSETLQDIDQRGQNKQRPR